MAWALVLPEADQSAKFAEAVEKLTEAVRLEPGNSEAWNHFGTLLLHWAQVCGEPERTQKLLQAQDFLQKAETLQEGSAAYNFACLAALKGATEDAREWLEKAWRIGSKAVNCPHLNKDRDLDSLRELAWFQEYLAKVCSSQKDG